MNSNKLITEGNKTFGCKNLLDRRPQGYGKSTEARTKAINRAEEGFTTIYCVEDYKTAEEFAEEVRKESPETPVMIFRGKPQPGMCKILENLDTEKLYQSIEPLFICRWCPYKDGCNYISQKEEIKEIQNKGGIIFCVSENLPVVMKRLKNPTAVLDDVDIKTIWRHTEVSNDLLAECVAMVHPKCLLGHLGELRRAMEVWIDRSKPDMALDIAKSKRFAEQLKELEKEILLHREYFENDDPVKLNLFYTLYKASRAPETEYTDKWIAWKDDTLKRASKIELIKAETTWIDEELFKEFGEFEVKEAKPKNDKVRILQVTDGSYCQTSFHRRPERFEEFCDISTRVAELAKSFGLDIYLVAPNKIIRENQQNPVFSKLKSLENINLDYHYSATTTSTNRYVGTIPTILGILNKNPKCYHRPPYSSLIEKKHCEQGVSYNDILRQMMVEETASQIKDTIERARLSTSRKRNLAIIYSNIDLDKYGLKTIKTSRENLENELKRQLAWMIRPKLKLEIVRELLKIKRGKEFTKKEVSELLEDSHGYFTLEFYKNVVGEVAKLFKGWIEIKNIKHNITYLLKQGYSWFSTEPDKDMSEELLKFELVDKITVWDRPPP